MKPILTRLFVKRLNGVAHVGFVRQQRFYPVDGLKASEGDEALVTEVIAGTPGWSGEYSVSFNGSEVNCRSSFYI